MVPLHCPFCRLLNLTAVLDTLLQVVSHATTLKGIRGEGEETAKALLKRLED